jgi:hypothetical protein
MVNDKESSDKEESNEYSAQPAELSEIATVEPTTFTQKIKKGKKVKGKGKSNKLPSGAKAATSPQQTLREGARCAFCTNPMTMSTKMNWQDIKGLKDRAVLCDTCVMLLEKGRGTVDLKTVVRENPDGTVSNIKVSELLAQ